jgi:hypothetical protein
VASYFTAIRGVAILAKGAGALLKEVEVGVLVFLKGAVIAIVAVVGLLGTVVSRVAGRRDRAAFHRRVDGDGQHHGPWTSDPGALGVSGSVDPGSTG